MQIQWGARGRRDGFALVYAVFGAFVAASSIVILMTLSRVSDTSSNVKRYGTQAKFLAEGGIEAAKKDVQEAIANWRQPPANGTATIESANVTYTVVANGAPIVRTDEAGIQTIINGYEIEARATSQGHTAVAHRIINAEATPVFQFAVFYTGDLEINPGPNMTLKGRVHSNRDIYLNSNGNTLTLNTNYLRSVGGIFRNRKDDPSLSQGTVKVRRWVVNPFDSTEPTEWVTMNSHSQMSALGVPNTTGYDSNFQTAFDAEPDGDLFGDDDWLPWGPGSLEMWSQPDGYTDGYGSTVMTSEHGMTEAVTPYIGSIQMFEEHDGGDYTWDAGLGEYVPVAAGSGTHAMGYFHDQADLSIIRYSNGTWKAFDNAGTNITSSLVSCGVVSTSTLYDARQANGGAGNTPVLTIDISLLKLCTAWPANGLIYAGQYGMGTGTGAKGVMLKNGSELKTKLTVVSEDPLYIQGDYNTVNKKGAAVIGDAVNLLSNAWDGTKTNASLLPMATNTTYNCAMISGNQNSTVGGYNGGLENLPRFHEKWSGKTCTIAGSFVNTWLSAYATGAWVYGANRYEAPTRVWNYDTAFNNIANLPPFTPMAVTAVDVVSW